MSICMGPTFAQLYYILLCPVVTAIFVLAFLQTSWAEF